MENTVSAAEADPLKRAEDGGEMPSSTQLKKKKSCNEVLGFAKLTHWRTAVFFLSLFLCLTIVFAFSFIIPCPVRPQYLISWNRTFPKAGLHKYRFGWLTSELWQMCKDYCFFHRNLWIFSYWRYKQGQSQRYPLCSQKFWRQSEQYVHWSRYDI